MSAICAEALERRVGAHRRHFAGSSRRSASICSARRQHLRHGILAGAERRERHALHAVGPRRLGAGAVQPGPQRERQRRENGCDDNAGRSHRVNVAASGEEYTRCETGYFQDLRAAAAAMLLLPGDRRPRGAARTPQAADELTGSSRRSSATWPAVSSRIRTDNSDRELDDDSNFGLIVNAAVDEWRHYELLYATQSTSVDGVDADRHGRAVPADRRHRQPSGRRAPRHSVFRHHGRRGALQSRRAGPRRRNQARVLDRPAACACRSRITSACASTLRAFVTVLDSDGDIFCVSAGGR